MILVVHNRYRTTGGEERAVEDFVWLTRERLGEEAELLTRDSAAIGRAAAGSALLRGGSSPGEVADAVRRTGAGIVHAHNVNPSFGWRGLAAARAAGARVVLHLHNYRLVCAVGTCFTRGEDCTRCHGRWTWPGVRLACRGDRAEAAVYGAGLALWQRRLAAQVDAFAVPSEFALGRLRELGAPLGDRATVIPNPARGLASRSTAAAGEYALLVSRLSPEKGVEIGIEACVRAGVPVVVAGDGPLEDSLQARFASAQVTFEGHVGTERMRELRARAGVAVIPSRSAEVGSMVVIESLAAGLPLVATRVGSNSDLVPEDALVAAGDPAGMAAAIAARFRDAAAGERGLAAVRARQSPAVVAEKLGDLYAKLRAA